jgi:hypothetical protein
MIADGGHGPGEVEVACASARWGPAKVAVQAKRAEAERCAAC